ncbi:hypothetical protein IIC44_00325 [Patescibacteria group bacterium]|nr:hypothetical protein [Patescibacteria group bacterium]
MKFNISLKKEHLLNIMRECKYAPDGQDPKTGEFRFFRSLGGRRYPRFHIYAKEQEEIATLNIHLDQKQVSYEGSSAHSGEYEGSLIEQEVERILSLA